MVSGIDHSANISASITADSRPQVHPSSTLPVDSSVTIPTPATEHAPKGYIIDDSARGTIFWEAESDDNTATRDQEDEASTAETTESDTEQNTLGHPFRIEWLSIERLPFHRARGLRNPWNQNREVKIARDGTEIEPLVGRRLINLFHIPEATAPSAGPPSLYRAQIPAPPTIPYPDPRFGRHY